LSIGEAIVAFRLLSTKGEDGIATGEEEEDDDDGEEEEEDSVIIERMFVAVVLNPIPQSTTTT